MKHHCTIAACPTNVDIRAGHADIGLISSGVFEKEMKNLASEKTVTTRHALSISMSLC